MTDDTEFTLGIGAEAIDELQETDTPVRTTIAIASDLPNAELSLAAGGVVLFSALRSRSRGRLRSILRAIGGLALLWYGIRTRRSRERANVASVGEETASDAIGMGPAVDLEPEIETGDDGGVSIDISERAVETSEATGSDPEQAQQTRTDATEDEASTETGPESEPEHTDGEVETGDSDSENEST